MKKLLLFSLAAGLPVASLRADTVETGTNSISGVVSIVNTNPAILARLDAPGNEGLNEFSIYAYVTTPELITAGKAFTATNRLTDEYALTVVADNTPLAYNVYAVLFLDGSREEYTTSTQVAAPVTSNSAPATVNFDECVALAELRFVDTNGAPLAVSDLRATATMTGAPFSLRARCYSQPAGLTNNFLALPGGVELDLRLEVDTGESLYSNRLTHVENVLVNLDCEAVSVINVTIPGAGGLGRIVGRANLADVTELPTDGYLDLLGRPVVIARGPASNQRYADLGAEWPGAETNRAFALPNLPPSAGGEDWRVFAELQYGLGYRFTYFRTPGLGDGTNNPPVVVTAGVTNDLGDTFVMNAARLVGNVTLTGPPEFGANLSALRGVARAADYDLNFDGIPDGVGPNGIGGSYLVLSGADELAGGATRAAAGGLAAASFAGAFSPASSAFNGDYEIAVGVPDDQPGIWRRDGFNCTIYFPATNGGPYVNESVYITENNPWQGTLAPGARETNHVNYGFGEVTVRVKSSTPFYAPRVNGTGALNGIDSQGQSRNYSVNVSTAYGKPVSPLEATNNAVVTMYLPEGHYTLQPTITTVDPGGGETAAQLPDFDVNIAAGQRQNVEDCLRLALDAPYCATNFGMLARAYADSCVSNLVFLSLRSSPVFDPSIRLGYSDIRILVPVGQPRTNLTTAHGLFPVFDGFPAYYYSNILYTITASNVAGQVYTLQTSASFEVSGPVINAPTLIVTNATDAGGAVVNFSVTTDGRNLNVTPPSGTRFPIGTNTVTCVADDYCYFRATNTFQVVVLAPGSQVFRRCEDFNGGALPGGAQLLGNAAHATNGGYTNSGVVRLTTAVVSQIGSLILDDPAAGATVNSIEANFRVRIGNATATSHADGMSFVWASDAIPAAFGEELQGALTTLVSPFQLHILDGLAVSFDTHNNAVAPDPPEAPSIEVLFNDVLIARTNVPLATLARNEASQGIQFTPVTIAVSPAGLLRVSFDNVTYFSDLPLPGFAGITGGRFAWGARTGAQADNHFVDNICLTALAPCVTPTLSIEPSSGDVTITYTGTLESADNLDGPWTLVSGATSPHTLAASGPPKFFRAAAPCSGL